MNTLGLLGLFCGISVAIGLLVAYYLRFIRKSDQVERLFLGGLFVAISLRIAKSIWFFILYDVTPIGLMMGFVGLSLIGPLMYLFIRRSNSRKGIDTKDMIHLIIPLTGAVLSLFSTLNYITIAYKTATGILAVYLFASFWLYFKSDKNAFNLNLLIAVFFVWCAFVFQHWTETLTGYAIGAGIASMPIYFMAITLLKEKKTRKSKVDKADLSDSICPTVQEAFEKDKIYLQQNLTLNKVSNQLDIPAYLISKAVNALYDKTLPETINHFRVEEAKNRLIHKSEFFKIEGLSYEVGFKTVSAFYAAFKKETGVSPTLFQREHNSLQSPNPVS